MPTTNSAEFIEAIVRTSPFIAITEGISNFVNPATCRCCGEIIDGISYRLETDDSVFVLCLPCMYRGWERWMAEKLPSDETGRKIMYSNLPPSLISYSIIDGRNREVPCARNGCGNSLDGWNLFYRIGNHEFCFPCGSRIVHALSGGIPTPLEGTRRVFSNPTIIEGMRTSVGRMTNGRQIVVIEGNDNDGDDNDYMEPLRPIRPRRTYQDRLREVLQTLPDRIDGRYDPSDPILQLRWENPPIKFFGTCYWIGIEVEIEFPSWETRCDFVRKFRTDEFLSEYGWLKSDSSLTGYGVEACSHAIAWDLWREGEGNGFLRKLISYAQEFQGVGLHQNKSWTGLHLSFDNSWFHLPTDIIKMYDFTFFNYEDLLTLSYRPSEESLNTYAHPRPHPSLDRIIEEIHRKTLTRYSILNIQNTKRIEFRLFNSVINSNFILAGMKFFIGLLNYTREFHEHPNFTEWDSLEAYIIEKGLGDIFLLPDPDLLYEWTEC